MKLPIIEKEEETLEYLVVRPRRSWVKRRKVLLEKRERWVTCLN
jgi:hypothetical protein